MDMNTYHCTVDPLTGFYVFYSKGPEGRIKKVVNYQRLDKDFHGMQAFNLCFGDWDDVICDICDENVTNNKDRDKVLATVADTVLTFSEKNFPCVIYGEGSTASRTRLYQMRINANWELVNTQFSVNGRIGRDWEPFRKGINYNALLVIRKSASGTTT